MLEERIKEGFGPLIAILTSDAVETIIAKNKLTFAELLLPFRIINCTLKDPSGQSTTSRIHFDFRDLRRDGFLLSLTVLPSVLHEAVSAVASTSDTELAATVLCESLLHWAEPTEYEFLHTYLACMFVISSNDSDPMNELAKLVHMQHSQQHGGSTNAVGPAHCVPPKWLLPNIYKFYVLLHDLSADNDSRTNELFSSMCSTYGVQNCHLLRINSGKNVGLPDIWENILEKRYRGLQNGLILARKNVLSKSGVATDIAQNSYKSVDLMNSLDNTHSEKSLRGQFLTVEDRENITKFVDSMFKTGLIPFFERQISILNEQITARRGISKSFATGMRKWFGTTSQPSLGSNITYSMESTEMQTRRLADLSFIFGLYSYAYQVYQNIKKEFAVDQAWLYHAGALEMTAISAFLNTPQITAKQYPAHYMDNAIGYYSNCGRSVEIIRAALLSTLILTSLEMYVEAATQLLKLTVLENDLYSGILLERASNCFGMAKMIRKMAFHYVLAGHRLHKAGQKSLSLECYRRALPEYAGKNWQFAEDHILYTLVNENKQSSETFALCERLIRAESQQNAEQQQLFLKAYISLLIQQSNLHKIMPTVKIPLVNMQNIATIYGNVPLILPPEVEHGNDQFWKELEQNAFQIIAEESDIFRPSPTVSCSATNNAKIHFTPPYEKFRVFIELKNPLEVPLQIKQAHLDVKGHLACFQQNFIDTIILDAHSDWTVFEFFVFPNDKLNELTVCGLIFDLFLDGLSVTCQIPLVIRGPRLYSTKKQITSVIYGVDHRLKAHVSTDQWPLLNIEMPLPKYIDLFCGQFYRFNCTFTNTGSVPVKNISLVTNQAECLSIFEEVQDGDNINRWKLAWCTTSKNNKNVLIFKLQNSVTAVGESRRLKVALRAPQIDTDAFNVCLLFYYRGINGLFREERFSTMLKAKKLLKVSLRLIDLAEGSYVLNLKNDTCLESVLVKVELLRLRLAQNFHSNNGPMSAQFRLFSSTSRSVKLDCGQCENFCFRAVNDVSLMHSPANSHLPFTSSSMDLWLSSPVSDLPEWPVSPLKISDAWNKPDEQKSLQLFNLGLLWKANIVNTDGLVSNVFGESFIENSFISDYSTVNEEISRTECVSPLLCSVSTESDIILHDFSVKRLCQIPVQIMISNRDIDCRNCDVVLEYITPSDSFRLPRINSAETRLHLSSASQPLPSAAFLQRSSISQPLIVANRSVFRARILYGHTHIFRVKLSVPCASVYSISCFRANARFDNSETVVPIVIPNGYVTVIMNGSNRNLV